MPPSFAQRLSARADLAGLQLTDALRDRFVAYFEVLSRWNSKINLTSLADGDEAIERLLLEPLAAASRLPRGGALMDLGSGGGSPAIPLALALNASRLVMVESRGRKAAFLREAARVVALATVVHEARFEDLSSRQIHTGEMDIVSMRAVRMDVPAMESAVTFLTISGCLALFVTAGSHIANCSAISHCERYPLVNTAELLVCGTVPRGTLE